LGHIPKDAPKAEIGEETALLRPNFKTKISRRLDKTSNYQSLFRNHKFTKEV